MLAEEKPHLGALPLEPFRYYSFGDRTVNLDGCIEVEAAYYGAPPGWIGRRIKAQWDEPTYGSWIPRRASCYESISGPGEAAVASRSKTVPSRRPAAPRPSFAALTLPAAASEPSASRSTGTTGSWRCGAFWECSPWAGSTVCQRSRTPRM
jgi:hypothetical protein